VTHPERIVPDETEPGIVAIHLKRYEFARPLCAGKEVLDAACGVGYGTAYLAKRARRAVGVDVDSDAIAYARKRYARPNVEFLRQDLAALDLPDASFDVVCSFETIEHLAQPEAFLAHAARVLRGDGVFVVSTPRVDATTSSPENPFHAMELSRADFEALLGRFFGAVELYGQHRIQTRRHRLLQRADVLGLRRRLPFVRRASRVVAGTPAMDSVTADQIAISRDGVEQASELVAVCRP
jgi:2-polyprenyl-3-methyl-5-hydroxy-6-metoxy-1,4-benzoquinol methylase